MDIPLREDTIQLARAAKQDQGNHEMEVSFNGEGDLQRALVMCNKHPGHQEFIPMHQATADNFPQHLADPKVVEFMKSKANETVRVKCDFTSLDRPPSYPFYKYRGRKMLRLGSGRVWSVYLDQIKSDIPCPFPDCQEAPKPHTVHGYLRIHTAKHVVFNDAEAQQTTVEFFYDRPDDRSNVVTARGLTVVQSDSDGDYCVMDCVTHDPELCSTMHKVRQQWSSLWPSVKDIIYGHNTAVVVSHPHGCAKQFSFGTCLQREWGQASPRPPVLGVLGHPSGCLVVTVSFLVMPPTVGMKAAGSTEVESGFSGALPAQHSNLVLSTLSENSMGLSLE